MLSSRKNRWNRRFEIEKLIRSIVRESSRVESIQLYAFIIFIEREGGNIFREACYIFDIVSPEMEFRTGVSGREMNDPEREKERERERTKRNEESVFKKMAAFRSEKLGLPGFQIKFGPTPVRA